MTTDTPTATFRFSARTSSKLPLKIKTKVVSHGASPSKAMAGVGIILTEQFPNILPQWWRIYRVEQLCGKPETKS